MTNKDNTLEKILEEVAKEVGVDVTMVIQVYNHFISTTEKKLSAIKFGYMSKEFVRQHAININIPGFGRILNRYGKTIRKKEKGITET